MADVEQMEKMISLITCDCQYVCELMFGVNVLNLNLVVQNDSVKRPIQSNSVGP